MSKLTSPHLLLVDGDPVGGGEPLVSLDVGDAVLEVAVPLGQVHLEQVAQQVLQVAAEVGREANLVRISAKQNKKRIPCGN